MNCDVLIIGAGPAGIFTAIELMRKSKDMKVILADSGSAISERACPARTTGKCAGASPTTSSMAGRAPGAFSDGKLSLSPTWADRLRSTSAGKRPRS